MAPNKSQQTAAAEDPKRKVLAHYFNIQSSLHLIGSAASRNGQHGEDLAETAAEAHNDINGIGEFLSSQIEPIYYNERRQPNFTIATRVLQIPELLEVILDDTEFIDVLRMSETCHGIRNAIYASSKLRVKLFLKPAGQDEGQQIECNSLLINNKRPWFYFGGLSVEFEMFTSDSTELDYVFDSDDNSIAAERILYICFQKVKPVCNGRRVGAKWKDMFICRPPVKQLLLQQSTCATGIHWRDNGKKISSVVGFTVRELHDTAYETARAKEPCCRCSPERKTPIRKAYRTSRR
jgi:hypothetical protein